jgi:hypothetical protein
MSRMKVLSAIAALLVVGGSARAQSSLTNIFKDLDKVISAKPALGASDNQSLMFSNPGVTYSSDSNGSKLAGSWAPGDPAVDLENFPGADSQNSLRGSFEGGNPNGEWRLLLSDLDFGEQGAAVKWDTLVTVIPEPSSWAFVGLGGTVLAVHFMRRLGLRWMLV